MARGVVTTNMELLVALLLALAGPRASAAQDPRRAGDPPPATAAPARPWWQAPRPSAPANEHVDPEGESRAREEVVTGWSLGVWAGAAGFKGAARARAAVDSVGPTFGLSLAMVILDHFPLAISFGGLILGDHMAFTQRVVDCTTVGSTPLGCSDPFDAKSKAQGSLLTLETGYQHRFWRSYSLSLLPGVFAGYVWNPDGMHRMVDSCDDCMSIPIDVHPEGIYVGPSFKLSSVLLGPRSMFALVVRTEFFLTGDLANRTVIGFEFGSQ